MADAVANVALGRINELAERVNNNDPTNSAFVLMLLQASSEADATLTDYDTFAAVLAGSNTEAAFTNYARIVLTDSDVGASTVNDSTDTRSFDIADQTWSSAGGASNQTVDKLLVGYDSDTTGGTDSNIELVAHYDFDITTNGGDITAQINASGLWSAGQP